MDTVKLKTRFEELSFPTSDPDEMAGRYLAADVKREWEDSFIDKNTGEVVTVTRSELVMKRGEFLSPDNISTLNFYFQCREIHSVLVTNIKRTAKCLEANKDTIWKVNVSEGKDQKKRKYILFAQSLDQALRIAKDYLEQTLLQDFKIVAAKNFSSCTIIQKELEEEQKEKNGSTDTERSGVLEFYNVSTTVAARDIVTDMNWLVLATSVDDARMKIRRHIDETIKQKQAEDAAFDASAWEGYELTVQSGTCSGVDAVIPHEFSQQYFKFEDTKKLYRDYDRLLKTIDKTDKKTNK